MSGPSDRGSASIWVLAGGVLVLAVSLIVMVRTTAVLARHRAESAADLAALAAAGGIGLDGSPQLICARAARIAAANSAGLSRCSVTEAITGRSGTVSVRVFTTVRLAGIGVRTVSADARAGRLAA